MLVDVWQLVERAEEVVVVVVVDADAVVDNVDAVNGRRVGDVFGIKPENVNNCHHSGKISTIPMEILAW